MLEEFNTFCLKRSTVDAYDYTVFVYTILEFWSEQVRKSVLQEFDWFWLLLMSFHLKLYTIVADLQKFLLIITMCQNECNQVIENT